MTLIADIAPLAIWDASDPSWPGEHWRERTEWAMAHIPDANRTQRAEFYLLDVPFAVLYRCAEDEHGRLRGDPVSGDLVMDDPVRLVLAGLPPPHLLERSAA